MKDEYNNCLYHCLEKLLGDRIPWKFAVNMKRFLKLKANDKISIDLIPELEEKLKKYKTTQYQIQRYESGSTIL